MTTLADCLTDHHKLDQHSGCCGFAAALMALLDKDPTNTMWNKIKACVMNGARFDPAGSKSTSIKARIKRRKDLGLINDEDHQLCLGLMLLLKEHLRTTLPTMMTSKDHPIWEACKPYSQCFAWTYAEGSYTDKTGTKLTSSHRKLKNVVKNIKTGTKINLGSHSYKKGDLCLTKDALKALLQMVGLDYGTDQVILDSTDFATVSGKASPTASWSSVKATLVSKYMNGAGLGFKGAILGMGYVGQDASFGTYGNIAHWVYLPAQSAKTMSDDLTVWTWGHDPLLSQLWEVTHPVLMHGVPLSFIPVYALPFL